MVFGCEFVRFELILNLLFSQIVVNTVTYCFYVWLVTEILRWVIGWAFFHEQSMNIVYCNYSGILNLFEPPDNSDENTFFSSSPAIVKF